MKKILLILAVLTLVGCPGQKKTESEKATAASSKEFCGWATKGACQTDADCQMSGCSKQVCMAQAEGEVITSCDFKECYAADRYKKQCGCVQNVCDWR